MRPKCLHLQTAASLAVSLHLCYVPGSASCALESLTGQELKQRDMTEGMGKVLQGKFRDPNELICRSEYWRSTNQGQRIEYAK